MSSLVENRKATFNYEILEKYEAGVELSGAEVKSIRSGHGSLEGAHVIIRGGEAFLVGATVPPYQVGNTPESYDSMRTRKLLLTKKEIGELANEESKKGLTIIPLSLYSKGRRIKLSFAVAKGKKKFDKRETIKKRETDREVRRDFKVH